MRRILVVVSFIAMLAIASSAFATAGITGTATLAVTATVSGSISVTLTSTGITAGSGTSAATSALGTVKRYGAASYSNWAVGTVSASVWSLTSPSISVATSEANTGSTTYQLSAKLSTTTANVAWKVDGNTITTTDSNIGSAVAYGTSSHNVAIEINNSVADSTAIDNTVTFTATSQ